jgi:hypothetical protein
MRAPQIATFFVLALLLLATPAAAKPWQGIDPGVSNRDQIIEKFGEPSRVVSNDGKEVIAYLGDKAIKGTTQVQFKLDVATKLVERIDVFPGPVIDKDAIENTYGLACPPGKAPSGACYVKKLTDDFRTYFLYPKLGVVIFFNEDGKTVQSFTFTAPKAAK